MSNLTTVILFLQIVILLQIFIDCLELVLNILGLYSLLLLKKKVLEFMRIQLLVLLKGYFLDGLVKLIIVLQIADIHS